MSKHNKILLFFNIAIVAVVVMVIVVKAWTNPSANPPIGSGSGAFVPAGAVMYFNLPSCPVGWSSMAAAQGRYIVGGTLDLSGIGTALSNQENRPVGQHNHDVSDPGHSHSISTGPWHQDGASNVGNSAGVNSGGSTLNAFTGIYIQNAGTTVGTNAPYIQLLVCSKD